jgi:hypothetical protein
VRFALDFAGEEGEAEVMHVLVLCSIVGELMDNWELCHWNLYVQARVCHGEIGFELGSDFGHRGRRILACHDFDSFHCLTGRDTFECFYVVVLDRLEISAIDKARDAWRQL